MVMGRLGPKWATLARLRLGRRGKITKNVLGCYGHRDELAMGYGIFFSQFSNKDLSFKIKDSNAFKQNLN
jgi:hypothetical protein